jgi:transposase
MAQVNRREYTPQTKADAVGQVIKAGLPMGQVARNFEMPKQTLQNWVRQAKSGDVPKINASGKAPISEQEAEISRLKAACARLTMERDILKKATAYFARDVL